MAHGQTGMGELSHYAQTESQRSSEFTLLTIILQIHIFRSGGKIEINSLFASFHIL